MKTILVFGANGSIGNHIFTQFSTEKYNVIGTTTNLEKISDNIIYVTCDFLDNLKSLNNIDIIVWAQGYNFNDNIETFDVCKFQKMMDGNVLFILSTLNYLLNNNKLNDNAKMVIISSIWENFSRENKLSYSISKASLSGLTKNIAVSLSKKNILVNNVLPGVIDNEMSRNTLSNEQFDYIKDYMYYNRLVTVDDVFKTVKFLVTENTGITGQSITVDLGFTILRKYS